MLDAKCRFLLVLPCGLLVGCITSPVWEYGATAEATEVKLKSCPTGLIDDAEDKDNQVVKSEGREGYWFTFVDTEGSTIAPKGEFTMAEGGPPGSKYAARAKGHLAASGKSLYAGLGFAFTSPKSPYDASKYKGVSFWAKGPGKIRFKAPDVNTTPEGDKCSDCYNDFGVELYLSDQWTRYTIPFEKLAQQPGWGDRTPAVAKDALFALQWQYSTPNTDYDIWIDNIELVGCE
jgi:endoglucanase